METHNHHKKIGVAAYEFIGTTLIMYAVMVTFGNVPVYVYGAMMMLAWNVSGGHFNPAITLGVYISQMKLGKDAAIALIMIVAQFAGALFGVLFGYLALFDNAWATE